MTNLSNLKPLVGGGVRAPRDAVARLISLNLPPQALWIALSLVSVVTSLIMTAIVQVAPLPQDEIGGLIMASPAYQSPLIFALMQWGRVVLSVFMLFWVGRMLGGQGQIPQVLAAVTLVQIVSFVLVTALTLAGMVLPFLSSLGMLLFFVWWVWALSNTLDVAHGFDNPLKAFGVLIVSIFGVLIGLSIFMGLIGGLVMGVTGAQ